MFVLDKKEGKIGQAVVTNNMQDVPYGAFMQQPQTMTLSFKYDNRDIVLTKVNATAASADDAMGSGLVVCESNDSLVNEVKAYVAYNEDMAAKKPYFEDRAKWGKSVLADIDPAQKVKAEYESQLQTIMSKYDEMFNKMKAENDDLRSRNDNLMSRLESRDTKKGKE